MIQYVAVLPAYAGMFPKIAAHSERRLQFSPRMRGCFSSGRIVPGTDAVLPAYAGMFLAGRSDFR